MQDAGGHERQPEPESLAPNPTKLQLYPTTTGRVRSFSLISPTTNKLKKLKSTINHPTNNNLKYLVIDKL